MSLAYMFRASKVYSILRISNYLQGQRKRVGKKANNKTKFDKNIIIRQMVRAFQIKKIV